MPGGFRRHVMTLWWQYNCQDQSQSTNGPERDGLVVLIACFPGSIWIQHWVTIDQKQVLMITVAEFQAGHPSAIRLLSHRRRMGIPAVEIAHE